MSSKSLNMVEKLINDRTAEPDQIEDICEAPYLLKRGAFVREKNENLVIVKSKGFSRRNNAIFKTPFPE